MKNITKPKKLISVLLIVSLVCSVFSFIGFADGSAIKFTATPDKTVVKAGDTVTLTVHIDHETDDVSTCSTKIQYDNKLFTPENITMIGSFDIGKNPNLNYDDSDAYIEWVYDTSNAKSVMAPNGKQDVAQVTFKAKADVEGKVSTKFNFVDPYGMDSKAASYTDITSDPVDITVKGVASLTLNQSSLKIEKNSSATLTANFVPKGDTLTWTSSNDKVAAIGKTDSTAGSGVGTCEVKGVAGGTATITCKTSSDEEKTCEVTVHSATETISINPATVTMNKGDKQTLTASVTPADANDPITWTPSDDSISIVSTDSASKTCVIKAEKGTKNATITATAGTQKATCAVTVNVPATGIDLPKTFVVGKGSSATIKASVLPADSSESIVSWSIDKTNIAKVTPAADNKSATIEGLDNGTATLTVKVNDKIFATCEITVSSAATNVSFDKEGSTMIVGDTMPLSAITVPDVTTDKLAWTNSDSSVASFDTSTTGNKITIKALKAGSTKITVRIPNGKAATYMLTVIDNTNLKAILDKTADLSTYTKASQTASNIATIRANAQAVYDKKTAASQDDIKTATERLTKAFESLQKLATADDKAPLSKALETVKDIKNDDGKYTKSSYKKFDEARTAAKGVFDNTDASVKEVADATATLNAAFKGLKEKAKPEKVNELKEKVDKVKEEINKLDKSKYTADSWNAVQSKLAAAEKLAADPDASAADVDAAIASVSNISEKSLTPVSKKDDHHKGDNGNGDNNGGNGTKPANTGDAIAAVGALALASAAAVVISKKKKFQD